MTYKIYCVIDSYGWVQEERINVLSRYIKDYYLVPITGKDFSKLWKSHKLVNRLIYFCSWRIPLSLKQEYGVNFEEKDYKLFMTSVTSHYNIGGGLNVKTAIKSGFDERKEFEKAVKELAMYRVVTVNSKNLYNLLCDDVCDLIYAPNGVDVDKFLPNANFVNNKIIGWTGKIKAAKNYPLLESVIKPLEDMGYTLNILSVKKSSNSIISRITNRLNKNSSPNREKIHSEMPAYYNSINFYLNTSFHEGTPNPALEAAASGIPVITTKVGNMPELIDDNKNGYFIEPTKISILSVFDKINKLSDDEYLAMSKQIRRDVANYWTWERAVEKYKIAFNILTKR